MIFEVLGCLIVEVGALLTFDVFFVVVTFAQIDFVVTFINDEVHGSVDGRFAYRAFVAQRIYHENVKHLMSLL